MNGGKAKAPARARTKAADLDADTVRGKARAPAGAAETCLLLALTAVDCRVWECSVLVDARFCQSASEPSYQMQRQPHAHSVADGS